MLIRLLQTEISIDLVDRIDFASGGFCQEPLPDSENRKYIPPPRASATKNAVRTINETLRQEAGDKLRVTGVSPGFVQTNLAESMTSPGVKVQIAERMEKMAMPPAAIARAIAFAIEQPAEVDVNEIVIRPTAQA